MKLIRIFIFLFSINALQSQTKEISLEDIWENRTFAVKSVPGFNFMKDGLRYSRLDNNQVKSIDIATGKNEQILLNLKEVNSDIEFDHMSLVKMKQRFCFLRKRKVFIATHQKLNIIPLILKIKP